ncbi:hypothetical protein Holit_03007 [Hollandina sp. SP2]
MDFREDAKLHYIGLIEELFNRISNMNGVDIYKDSNYKSIQIPIIGECYGKENFKKIAIYGMEPKDWGEMFELMKYKNCPEKAYSYLTEELPTEKIMEIKVLSFLGFVVKFLSEFYNIETTENMGIIKFNKKYNNILKSFIWGNIYSLEKNEKKKYKKQSDNEEPNELQNIRKIVTEIFDMHLFCEKKEYNPDKDKLKYILEICKPNILLILYQGDQESYFNCGQWMKSGMGKSFKENEWEKWEKEEIHYAHIKTDEIDTHVFKYYHPRKIKEKGLRFKDVSKKIINIYNENSKN